MSRMSTRVIAEPDRNRSFHGSRENKCEVVGVDLIRVGTAETVGAGAEEVPSAGVINHGAEDSEGGYQHVSVLGEFALKIRGHRGGVRDCEELPALNLGGG